MDGEWGMSSSKDAIPFEQLSSVKFHSKSSTSRCYKANLNNGNPQSVALTVSTVENEAEKARFTQEAALLKLLNHKCFPQFLGICSVPDLQTKTATKKSNGALLPAFITKADEGVSLERYLQDLEEANRRRRIHPYNELLDVLIEVADALQYLHNRRPKVIHRGISTNAIRVILQDNKLSARINTLRSAILSPEGGARVARLGHDSFHDDALVSEALLTTDFFKPTLIPTLTSFPMPSHRPQSPSTTEPDAATPLPEIRPRSSLAMHSSSRNKKSQNRSVSFNTEVTFLGQSSSTSSSICSSQNNWSTPDPKNKNEQRRMVYNTRTGSHGRLGEVRVIRTSISDFVENSGSRVLSLSKEMSPQKDCNNVLVTPHHSSSGPLTLEEKHSTRSALRQSCSIGSDPTSGRSSLEGKHSPHHQHQQKERKSKDLEVERSEITIDPENSISELDLSRSDGNSLPGIYREESMNYLRKQPGVNLAPEILDGQSYDTSVDIFNFGIVIYKTLTKLAPTILSKNKGVVQFSFPDDFPKEVQDLILKCCKTKKESRPNAREVGDQLRLIKEAGSLNALNKRWRSFFCLCGAP